jgi:hypothetical protein
VEAKIKEPYIKDAIGSQKAREQLAGEKMKKESKS